MPDKIPALSMPEYAKIYETEIVQPEEYGDRLPRGYFPEFSEEMFNYELTNCVVHDSNTAPRGELAA